MPVSENKEVKTVTLSEITDAVSDSESDLVYSIKSGEHPDERDARLAEEAAENRHRRLKDWGWMAAGFAILFLGVGITAAILVDLVKASSDDKKWATGLLGAACTAVLTRAASRTPGSKDKD